MMPKPDGRLRGSERKLGGKAEAMPHNLPAGGV